MTLATQDYMQSRYGVDQAEAQSANVSTYTARQGIETVGANAGIFWVNNKLSLNVFSSFNIINKINSSF